MTAGYCMSIELAAMWIEGIVHESGGQEFPRPTYFFTHPDSKSIWQVLALVSLLGNMFWGFMRARKSDLQDPHLFPAVCHLCWIVLWSFFHLIGFSLPHYKMGETI